MKRKFLSILVMNILVIYMFYSSTNILADEDKVDMIVFSYNRPIQLYALLESTYKYMKDINTVSVIYRVDPGYNEGYDEVKKDFPKAVFLKQSNNPYKDFKLLVLRAFLNNSGDYVVFAVDDIIVKDNIDLNKTVKYLKNTDAYGFYLRLGMNTTYCYMLRKEQGLPDKYTYEGDDIYSWKFSESKFDWRYPNTVDMTIYKKSKIRDYIVNGKYYNPTSIESIWFARSRRDLSKKGLFFRESKIVNIPMNLVQSSLPTNRNMRGYSVKVLLEKFNKNFKIDISKFHKINNNGAHTEYDYEFIKR